MAALCRAAGPSVGGLVLSRSLEVGKPWIVWVGLSGFSTIVFIAGWFLKDEEAQSDGYIPLQPESPSTINEDRREEEDEDADFLEDVGDREFREEHIEWHEIPATKNSVDSRPR
jgi:hypothetical protein